MTNQTNAAQSVLTEADIEEIRQDWHCFFRSSTQGGAGICIREIERIVLSKLHALVAADSVSVEQANRAVLEAKAALEQSLKQCYPLGARVRVAHHRGGFLGEVTGWDVYGVRVVVRNLSSGKIAKWWAAHVELAKDGGQE